MVSKARRSFKNDSQAVVPFSPSQVSAVSGWLRLAASTAVSGEWPTVVDVLNAGSPMVQPSANRKAAVGTSANGLPTMAFDGTDEMLWPLSPAHSAATKVGIWLWFKPASVSGVQILYAVTNTVAGADHRRLFLFTNGTVLTARANVTDGGGRNGSTASGALTVGVWHAIYLRYDSSLGGDASLALWINGVAQTLTYTNDGVGGTLGALQVSTGSAVVGAQTDSDTPASPILNGGEIGPNTYAFNDNLTAPQIAAFMLFEAPQ
jgi:hypothetical protein